MSRVCQGCGQSFCTLLAMALPLGQQLPLMAANSSHHGASPSENTLRLVFCHYGVVNNEWWSCCWSRVKIGTFAVLHWN